MIVLLWQALKMILKAVKNLSLIHIYFKFEGVEYSITTEEVAIFPQGYAALMTETGLLHPSHDGYIPL